MMAAALRCEEIKESSQHAGVLHFKYLVQIVRVSHNKTASRNGLGVAHFDQLMHISQRKKMTGPSTRQTDVKNEPQKTDRLEK